MNNILKMKRSEIDKNIELKNKILLFLSENNLELKWCSNYKQILYHYVNNIKEIPKCYCGKNNNFKSSTIGYRKTCSPKCSNNSELKKEKIKLVKIEKYGDQNYNNIDKAKKTKLEKYGDQNYNNREKAFKTNEAIYGSYSPMKNENIINLSKLAKLKKYGNQNYNNIDKIKLFWKNADIEYINNMIKKVKSTKLGKYKNENYNNPEKMILTKIEKYGFYFTNQEKAYLTKVKNGIIKTGDELKDWQFYRREVARFTRKNKMILFENWNGYDYYDNELIRNNFCYSPTSRLYPTIDHKISVYYGFLNNISPEIICDISNLCITKRHINSQKNKLIEDEFKKLLYQI